MLFMSDSTLLGFWSIRQDGRIADAPTWLPKASRQRSEPSQGPEPIRYRRTVAGHVVAWDEPGENF